jgi:hypothetical protein
MGGGGPTNSTVTQSNLPEYAKPYYENLMKRSQKESTTDYQPYKRDRIANMANETKTALGQASAGWQPELRPLRLQFAADGFRHQWP